jgi:outer membrane phospholipase A
VYYNLEELIAEAKDNSLQTSLAVFKPSMIKDFVVENAEREWSKEKLASLQQLNLFASATDEKSEVVKKLPYKFSYRFEDNMGKSSTLMIEDWEIGALFWNEMQRHNNDEAKAVAGVKAKYFDDFAKTKDLHLFLGTTFEFHARNAPNPFVIIGTFHPKEISQTKLF